ncbi:Mur ligase family protein [Chitinispirillales bacterium ANBcel5]|uniref:Mur ligase family protein n=1 Tax=Cellulosispirillum alkaliphilum TaxID=3039283 RepID=UPI002A5303A8|nr:Mur ligase family protein [Chitinispirillales bacterium ANBcel5]
MYISVNGKKVSRIHFTGILGSGMSAIAQFLRWKGLAISGSDRQISKTKSNPSMNILSAMGCELTPQDGSGIKETTDAICVSTAIENSNPDILAATEKGIPVFHRSDILASVVSTHKTIAVAGTSGKSTVTAMIFELLFSCGYSPSLLSGAALKRLVHQGLIGNAFKGSSDLLVIEADESDGTLVKYHPWISLILNVSKDHKPVDEVLSLFKQLSEQSKNCLINGDDERLKEISATMRFGLNRTNDFYPQEVQCSALCSKISLNDHEYTLPLPGNHNASNLMAALSVCSFFDCDPKRLVQATETFKGVDRRFAITQTASGVTVIDDFAHNPEKIKAAVSAARAVSESLFVIYQPHGFGPTRFLKNDYAEVFRTVLGEKDSLFLLPVYYAGGSAVMDIQSRDLITLMGPVPFSAKAAEGKEKLLETIKQRITQSCVLLMGARDPSLPQFAEQIIDALGGKKSDPD